MPSIAETLASSFRLKRDLRHVLPNTIEYVHRLLLGAPAINRNLYTGFLSFNEESKRYEISSLCVRWLNELLLSFALLEKKAVQDEVMRNAELDELFEYRRNVTTEQNQACVIHSLHEAFRSSDGTPRFSEDAIREQFNRVVCYSLIPPPSEIPVFDTDSTVVEMRRMDVFDLFVEWILHHPLDLPSAKLSPMQRLQCSFAAYLPAFFALAVLQAAYEVFVIVKKNGLHEESLLETDEPLLLEWWEWFKTMKLPSSYEVGFEYCVMQEVKKGIVQGISLLLRGFLQQCCLLKRILAYNPAVNENVAFSDSVDALCGELSLPPLSSFLHGDVLNSTQSQLIARSLQRLQQRHDQLNFDHIQCRLVRHHLLPTPLMVLPSQFQILRNTMFFRLHQCSGENCLLCVPCSVCGAKRRFLFVCLNCGKCYCFSTNTSHGCILARNDVVCNCRCAFLMSVNTSDVIEMVWGEEMTRDANPIYFSQNDETFVNCG
ncbi:hypothetical protein WA577_004528, partial [Blastocystis sp. JDR]